MLYDVFHTTDVKSRDRRPAAKSLQAGVGQVVLTGWQGKYVGGRVGADQVLIAYQIAKIPGWGA